MAVTHIVPPRYSKVTAEIIAKCPKFRKHVYGPDGYNEWHSWAEKMSKTHDQLECECGFYFLWKRKPKNAQTNENANRK